MFSVRGDGLTTITTDKPSVSAVVARTSSIDYSGVVLRAQTTIAVGATSFSLFKVSRAVGVSVK